MACIVPVRRRAILRAAAVSSPVYRRTLTCSHGQRAAQNFDMPAMSPTMTEGNIASWKIKEGDSFTAGDVLLEIETDKAQMDVEAQEDGVLAKIMQQDGSKAVKVGTRIAVLAEQGDDLSTLEIPPEEPSNSASAKDNAPSNTSSSSSSSSPSPSPPSTAQSSSAETSSPSKSETDAASDNASNDTDTHKAAGTSQNYPLYPSVQQLLHIHGIGASEVAKIPATGPKGRLLKGDVLAHIGQIGKDYSAKQSARIEKLGHLDLSNIKVAAPAKTHQTKSKETQQASPEPQEAEVAVQISLAAVLATQKRIKDSLGLTLPLSTFIARASELANDSLPLSENVPVSADELFDAVLGLDKATKTQTHRTSRGKYIPQVSSLGPKVSSRHLAPRRTKVQPYDIIDELSPAPPNRQPVSRVATAALGVVSPTGGSVNVFSVSAKKGEERRARTYLERMKTTLESEPGRCVL